MAIKTIPNSGTGLHKPQRPPGQLHFPTAVTSEDAEHGTMTEKIESMLPNGYISKTVCRQASPLSNFDWNVIH
jgi:hypothetical protein